MPPGLSNLTTTSSFSGLAICNIAVTDSLKHSTSLALMSPLKFKTNTLLLTSASVAFDFFALFSSSLEPPAPASSFLLLPALAFLGTYLVARRFPEGEGFFSAGSEIYWATAAMLAVMVGIIVHKKIKGLTVPVHLYYMTGFVVAMGALVIALQNDVLVYMKPPLVNLLFAGIIVAGLTRGINFIRVIMGSALTMQDEHWRILALRWAAYFVLMALWNEFLWRMYCPLPNIPVEVWGLTLSPAEPYSFLGLEFGTKDAEGVWAGWKLGNVGVTMAFFMLI